MIRKRYERIPFVAFFFAFMVAKGRSFGLLRYGERNDSYTESWIIPNL